MSSYIIIPLQVFAIGAVISYGIAIMIHFMLIMIQKFTKNTDHEDKNPL